MTNKIPTIAAAVFILYAFAAAQVPRGPSPGPGKARVYVAPFGAERSVSADILNSFTTEFENALIYSGCTDVIERREIDQLLKQIKNENALSTIGDLGISAVTKVRAAGANGVVFGDIDDDVNSGEFVISAKLVYFEGSRISWKSSTSMKRGVINDRSSRVDAVKALLSNFCSASVQPSISSTGEPPPGPVVKSFRKNDLLFELDGCRRQSSDVVCTFFVTAEKENRNFRILNTSVAFDQNGNRRGIREMAIANVSQRSMYTLVENLLIRNVRTRSTLTFDKIPSTATEFSLLTINSSESALEFERVPLQ